MCARLTWAAVMSEVSFLAAKARWLALSALFQKYGNIFRARALTLARPGGNQSGTVGAELRAATVTRQELWSPFGGRLPHSNVQTPGLFTK